MTTLAVMNRLLLTFLLLFPFAGSVLASPALQEAVRMHALREAATAAGGLQSKIDVVVGEVDPRLQLAPCNRTEVFLPAGARFWGRGFAGVRCLDGATWSITLPVTVRVFGPALVAARALSAGTAVQPDDVHTAEVEWTREAQGVVTAIAQLDQRVLARPISSGQPIALTALRAQQAVGQGEMVRVIGRGTGFSITADGIALASAAAGQAVRVRTESGKILTGTARAGRLVEVQF
jgi:flagellar basal body P-ring formation protein FlgA